MNSEEIVRLLSAKKLPVFSFENLCAFYPAGKPETLKKYVFRWKKKGWIAGLRKGLYELTFPADLKIPDLYLANKLYDPSYVSLETALSIYGIIPEIAMAVMSVTSKPTRRFKNKHGMFYYRTIQPKAFCGYRVEKYGGYDVFIAEPEKAFADYLYLNNLGGKRFNANKYRIDMKRIKRMNLKKLAKYCLLYGINIKELLC